MQEYSEHRSDIFEATRETDLQTEQEIQLISLKSNGNWFVRKKLYQQKRNYQCLYICDKLFMA